MGLEDRNWYREETAKKNGMRYNKSNATYSAASKVFDSAIRNAEIEIQQSAPIGSDWHWSLKLVLFLAIILIVTFLVRFFNSLA